MIIKKINFNHPWSMIILAGIVGIITGFFAVLFRHMILWAQKGYHLSSALMFPFWEDAPKVFAPVLAGLVVGLITYQYAREVKGTGIPEVIEAVALKNGMIRKRVILAKTIAAASSIGSGASVGREGPIVQIGSGIGSLIGQIFQLHVSKMKTCVACGAAAGIAATFNAPIAGVIFAQEVILGEFVSTTFVSIVISAVTASVIAQIFMGDMPAFIVESYTLHHPLELNFYVFLGILSALIGIIFVKSLYKFEDFFLLFKHIPEWIKPMIGGLFIGLIGLQFPEVLGVGYETIEGTFQHRFVLSTLILLVFVKIIATSITLGTGHSGGIFAPSLFIGATFGAAFGIIMNQWFPQIVSNPEAYAIVGMGAVVAGTTQAPIAAVLMIFEMTRDYHIVLPLMLSVVFSTLLFSYLSDGESIYTLKLVRRGIHLKLGKDLRVMKKIKVADVMTKSVEVCRQNTKVGKVIEMMHNSKHNGFPVLNEKTELVGMVTLQDVREAPVEGIMERMVSDLMSHKLITTYPDETLEEVFHKFSRYDIGHLPVVLPDNPKKLIGILTRSDVIKAYDKQLLSQ